MTFLQLQNLVASILDDLNFGYFTTDQVKVWLNNAQKEIQKKLIRSGNNYYLKHIQTNLIVGQSEYVLPLNFKKLNRLEVVISGMAPNETVSPISPITLNQQDLVYRGSGTPMCYFLRKNRLVLSPCPDQPLVLRMNHSYQIADMTLDTDMPDIPEDYHELIALLAAEDGFIKDERTSEKLNKKIAQYENDFANDASERLVDMPRQIVETGDSVETGFYW